mgnify:CR=1 FL=1
MYQITFLVAYIIYNKYIVLLRPPHRKPLDNSVQGERYEGYAFSHKRIGWPMESLEMYNMTQYYKGTFNLARTR